MRLDPAILGHAQPQADLLRAHATGRLAHAHLFTGASGIGKRLVARALARALVCQTPLENGAGCGVCRQCKLVAQGVHADVQEFSRDKSVFSVQHMRDNVLDWAAMRPREGMRKVGILDDVEYLGVQAANAFLKTLEEPSEGISWILISGRTGSALTTIISRCRVVYFSPLKADEVEGLLKGNLREAVRKAIAERELERPASATNDADEEEDEESAQDAASLSPGEASFVRRYSQGSPGEALNLIRNDTMLLRDWLTDQFLAKQSKPVAASSELLARLTRKGEATQEGLRERLRAAVMLAFSLLRDFQLLQLGQDQGLLHQDRIQRIRRLAEQADPVALEFAQERLTALHDAIGRNANLKIVAANLLLETASLTSGRVVNA